MTENDEAALKAFREVFQPTEPDRGQFIFNAIFNTVVGPLITWGCLANAEILPVSISGFLAVASFVVLMRLCILDVGIAKMSYVPIQPIQTGDNNE